MILTLVIIFLSIAVFTIIILYVVATYFFPRKLEEIAEMIAKGQTKLAIRKLTDVLQKDERNMYAHFLLAEAYLKENNIQYAVVEYRQVLKMGGFNDKVSEIDIRRKIGRIYKDTKKISEAKNEYLILTKLDPDNYEYYFSLGEIFYEAGVLDKALSYLKKSVQLNSKNGQAHYLIGQISYRSNSFPEAKNAFIETIKVDQGNYKAHYFLGLVLRHLGDHEWAIKEFEIAQKSEDIRTKCFLAKGTCYLEKEQYPKAIIEFERGLKFTVKGSDTELNMRYFLAEAQEKIRDIHSAIQNWEKIFEVNKKFRDVDQKLKSYEDFRQDDRIKDFLIASLSNFEFMCRKIVEAMGMTVVEVNIINDTEIEIFASENEDRRNTRRVHKLIRIIRTTESISDNPLRRLHEAIKPKNAQRAVVITTGEFSQAAVDFSNTRPIELYDKTKLLGILRSIS
ncbi:MAG: tetratricopeptide repeat protein [Spirochaetota bacterium]